MSWSVRHQGSPRPVANLTFAQVIAGLQDGLYETTDEVRGPGDARWLPMEDHPQLEELCLDLEALEPRHHEDETHLDMNPLIDVCLVLLVFFILTTAYLQLERVLNVPLAQRAGAASTTKDGVPRKSDAEVDQYMIRVKAEKVGDRTVVRVQQGGEMQEVRIEDLQARLADEVRRTKKTEVLVDLIGVDWGTGVKIGDAAAGAKIKKVRFNRATPR